MKKRIGMYPGSFDPVTKGHMNYFPAQLEKSNISSTYVRQLASFHADISPFVPAEVLDDIASAFSEQ